MGVGSYLFFFLAESADIAEKGRPEGLKIETKI